MDVHRYGKKKTRLHYGVKVLHHTRLQIFYQLQINKHKRKYDGRLVAKEAYSFVIRY